MANLNRILLIGRLTADPEVRFTVDGTPMAKFSLAVDRVPQEGTDFINVVAWRRLAEICGQYLKKGRLVLIEGRIQVRAYEVEGSGRRWITEVVARKMQMLEKPAGTKPGYASPAGALTEEEEIPAEEDLPF